MKTILFVWFARTFTPIVNQTNHGSNAQVARTGLMRHALTEANSICAIIVIQWTICLSERHMSVTFCDLV